MKETLTVYAPVGCDGALADSAVEGIRHDFHPIPRETYEASTSTLLAEYRVTITVERVDN